MKVKRPSGRPRNMFGAGTKIMGEEQLVDPPIHYITSVNAPQTLVLN